MEIENFWKGLKPYRKIEKGQDNCIGYGFSNKRRKPYNKRNLRKAYRQIRKYGFDITETWSLDCTIMRWLSDNFGGFFKVCGESDSWADYDLDGNYTDFIEHYKEEGYIDNMASIEKKRSDSFETHLKDFLDNATKEDYKKIAEFCSPRLRLLSKTVHGWPVGITGGYNEWYNKLNAMADAFDNGTYSEDFIEYFFNLWD